MGRGVASAGPQAVAALSTSAAAAAEHLKPSNIWCVGRNYAEHIKELGNQGSAPTDAPMIFLKAGSSALPPGPLPLPAWSQDVHHEVELAIELGPDLQPVRGAVALDLTARDVQAKLKKAQWPWTLAKSFPASTPLGPAFPLQGVDVAGLHLHLEVNGKVRQSSPTSLMLFSVPVLLQYVKAHFPVVPGDVVLTGTPHGVSKLAAGDVVVAQVRSGERVLSTGTWTVK